MIPGVTALLYTIWAHLISFHKRAFEEDAVDGQGNLPDLRFSLRALK
jgi:hypothetical protein